jgi:hypothetical protein
MVRHLLFALMIVPTACSVPIDSGNTGTNTSPDAAEGSGAGSGSGGGVTGDAGTESSMFPCKNAATPSSNGHHNPGQDCLNGCHNHGFTLAGTLYDAAGATALPGGSITVKDANGATFDMVAQQNGNFYTSKSIAFPITVYASSCPTSTPMTAAITTGNGGCNKSGCHASGGQGHVHL